MKNRDYKAFAAGEHYHIFNRGNGKMDIFREPADYAFFLSRLEEYLYPQKEQRAPLSKKDSRRKSFPPGSFTLVSYCLMPNHFHLVLRQNREVSLGALMLNLITGYSKYFNKKYDRVGSLFQDQFKAVHVDSNEYLLWLSAYVHQNPKVAGLTSDPHWYPYSSYHQYLEGREGLCEPGVILEQFATPNAYKEFMATSFEMIRNRKDLAHLLLD